MFLRFSDLPQKVKIAQTFQNTSHGMLNPVPYPNAVAHVVNAHGRFYGLRSKYDGKGNLRTPVKAAVVH